MRIWLDDTRTKPQNFDIHVTTPEEAIDLLTTNLVTLISLDHDLGLQPETRNGYMVACWIEQQAYNNTLKPLKWLIHSANPTGRVKMAEALRNADKFWNKFNDSI